MTLRLAALVCGLFPLLATAADPTLAVHVLDLDTGKIQTIATEPLPGHLYCGSPSFSFDGKRVMFDATPGQAWNRSRVVTAAFPSPPMPQFTDLCPGNCPTWSPDGKRIAFLLNSGAVPDAQPGIWTADLDGQNRKHHAVFGIPKWSPDGRHILVVSFSNPCQWTLLDVATGTTQEVTLPFYEFLSVPSWTDEPNRIVSVIRGGEGLQIALVDITKPEDAQLYDTLWLRGQGLADEPLYPVYSADREQLVFVARNKEGCELFTIDSDGPLPRPLEAAKRYPKIASLSLSPDGRHLLFCRDDSPKEPRTK